MAIEYLSDLDLEKTLGSNHCVVVLYSFEQEYDLRMGRLLGRIANERSDGVRLCAVKLNGDQERAQRHQISAAPVIRIFVAGKPVAQLQGVQARDAVSRQIDSVMNLPIEQLTVLSEKEFEVRVIKGEWTNAVTSGILAGAVFGFAMHYFRGVLVFMVPASAVGFFILNENFRFSWEQKTLAIGLMLAIGFLGGDFLQWAFAR